MLAFPKIIKLATEMREAQKNYFAAVKQKNKKSQAPELLHASKTKEREFKEAFNNFIQSEEYSEVSDGTTTSKHLLFKLGVTHLLEFQELAFKEMRIGNHTAHVIYQSRQQEKEFDNLLEELNPTPTQQSLF